ncbi:hypothetical protein P6U16_13490 [Rhizobium sp. 32-5/1]|uniref:hypothetical protein n=1 Tax=Rhizobium sp. 32-5/1 TaxID=3019602 RepID=UPI00240D6CD2|nr:hypothetical protein [Rhizobium sp. 32-5/1]WEZ82189.1 hypothetical protein P6U16_13490 [Rhizobium sp. 32-5/1]
MSELVFKFEYSPADPDKDAIRDDFGRLTLSVTTEHFAGNGGFWVQWQDIVEFADRLTTFPIALESPISAQWGFRYLEGDDLILGVRIAPANSTGGLLVSVDIADDRRHGDRLKTSFLTNYADVETFRRSLLNLMDRKIDQAVLTGP